MDLDKSQHNELYEKYDRAYLHATGRSAQGLSPDELNEMVDRLAREHDLRVISRLIDIVTYAGSSANVSSLEKFLRGPNVYLAHRALEVLCDYWGMSAEYKLDILNFARGVEWDSSDRTLQRDGLSLLSYYLGKHDDPALMKELAAICENEDMLIRNELAVEAYEALRVALRIEDECTSPVELLEKAKQAAQLLLIRRQAAGHEAGQPDLGLRGP